MQIKAEYQDQKHTKGHKPKDSLASFYAIRYEIIKQHAPDLPENTLQILTTNTRGLRKEAIIDSLKHFMKTGEYPEELAHKTNTCDPNTGNWVEHLLNPYSLKEQLTQQHFNTTILNGYYGWNKDENLLKKTAKKLLNFLIFSLKNKGIYLTHYWLLAGKYQSK